MTEPAELAGIRGVLDHAVDPGALPESFEWRTDADLTERDVAAAEQQLRARIDDPKGAPLAFPNRAMARDVLVDIATVRRHDDGGLLAVLRERSGTAARTTDD